MRERLTAFSQEAGRSSKRVDHLIQVAAGHVGLTLTFLDIGAADIAESRRDYQVVNEQLKAVIAEAGPGSHALEGEALAIYEAQSRAVWIAIYRIDSFFVFARVLLDDIAALIDRVFRPVRHEVGGSHSKLADRLPRAVAEYGLEMPYELEMAIAGLDVNVTLFRDKHVVHRSRLTPRIMRGLALNSEGLPVGLNVGGIAYPRESEEVTPLLSANPSELHAELLDYLGLVITLLENKRRHGARVTS